MNFARLIDDNITRFGEYPFVCSEGQWDTNVETNQLSNRLGNALKSLGIKKGDRVGVQLWNSPQVIQSLLATLKIGAIWVPVNPVRHTPELAYIYQDTAMAALITSKDFLERINEARREVTTLKDVILIDEENPPKGMLSYNKILEQSSDELLMAETDNDDIAVILYTAGTTGMPKGVIHTHYYYYSGIFGCYDVMMDVDGMSVKTVQRRWDITKSKIVEEEVEVYGIKRDITLISLPLFHGYGIFVTGLGFLKGGKLILLKRWDPEEAMKLIEQYRVIETAAVPTMYIQMLNHPNADKYDLSSLEICGSAGAPLPVEVAYGWEKKFGTIIREGYGLTESLFCITTRAARRAPKYGSLGVRWRKADTVKIFDEDSRELPPGKEGEIVIKGPTIMKGYWNSPEETAEVLREGWLHTGDIGYIDEDGYIWLTERKKDLIIRGGENIYPREIEDVLYKHPQVLEAGVVGVPDPLYGDEVKAFVALKTGASITEEELISFCKQHLPRYKTPKSIQFMDSLPRSVVGKILRKELRTIK